MDTGTESRDAWEYVLKQEARQDALREVGEWLKSKYNFKSKRIDSVDFWDAQALSEGRMPE
jgi:hypothetical protein